jgi:hypothetical protein
MSAINFIGGEKGGVGKSVVARVLAQFFIDRQIPFVGFDTDRSHATFRRFYGDYAAPTVIDDYASLDRIAEAISAEPGRQVLVDLAAQTMPALSRWIDDSGLVGLLAEQRIPLRFWHVMDDGKDSLALLANLLATYGPSLSYVVVLNHGRGADFRMFHASEVKTAALEEGATVIELRRLHEASMRKIDRFDTSFWAAMNHRGGEQALGLLERQRLKVWLARTHEDIARIVAPVAVA